MFSALTFAMKMVGQQLVAGEQKHLTELPVGVPTAQAQCLQQPCVPGVLRLQRLINI